MNIREHIINNFKGDDYESLKNAIDESIREQDEVTLPGMGVFFEIVWEGASEKLQDEMLEIIKNRVSSGEQDDENDTTSEEDESNSEQDNEKDENDTPDEDEENNENNDVE